MPFGAPPGNQAPCPVTRTQSPPVSYVSSPKLVGLTKPWQPTPRHNGCSSYELPPPPPPQRILPVVAWVVKAYYAPVPVIRQVKLVYHVTTGTNSWGITLPILLRPRLQGGLALPEPELFLMHQAAAPFVSLLREPHKYPSMSVETFYAWATSIGFTPSKDNLPYIQLGMCLRKKKKQNKCSRGSISSCPYLRSLLEKSGCGGDEQKSVKKGGNG